MNKKILVTGAHGFIGRHTSRLFGERGWEVTGIGHGEWTRKEWEKWNITRWHSCDLTIETLKSYAGEPDVIIHCSGSGSVGFSVSNPLQDFQKSVDTTAHVLEFARLRAPAVRIVLPSSAAVYGNAESMPISEDSNVNPTSPYGEHKKISEEICRSYGHHFGIRSVIVRLFSAYGEGLMKQLLWDACTKLSRGEKKFSGTGNETRDLIHVRDAVNLLHTAAEYATPDSTVVNGGSGVGIKVSDILAEIFANFGRTDQPEFTGESRSWDPLYYVADITKALSWGWRPEIDWRVGISAFTDWYFQTERD